MHSLKRKALATINWDGVSLKPTRSLVALTATSALLLDIRAQIDIAAGGGADGAVVLEGTHRLVRKVRIFDGSNVILEMDGRELAQIARRRSQQAPTGVDLANTGIQAATMVRQHVPILFSDPWSLNPIEVHLRPRDPSNFYLEIEWAGITQAALAAAFNVGGTRAIAVTNLAVDVTQVHDPVAFRRIAPLFLPVFKPYDLNAPGSSLNFPFPVKTGRYIRWALLHTMDTDLTTEAIINQLTFEDDSGAKPDENILARTWHEDEQRRFGGVGDDTGVGMAYFFKDYADNGRLGQIWTPGQGANPQWTLNVTGGANRVIRLVQCELERVSGITTPELPAGLD